MGGSKAQRKRRVRRVLELRTMGMTILDISKVMKGEGYAASERTVWSDLNSVEAKEYLDEILLKQLRDIALADIGLRLKHRGNLIDKLLPSKIEGEVQGDLNFILRAWRPEYDKEKDEEDGRGHN